MSFELLNLSLCFTEVIMVFLLLHSLLEKRVYGKRYMILFLISIFAIIVLLFFMTSVNTIYRNLTLLLVIFFIAFFLYVDVWYIKGTIIILSFYIILITDIIISDLCILITGEHLLELFHKQFEKRLIFCYTIKFIDIFIFIWVHTLLRKINFRMRKKEWLMFGITFSLFWLSSIVFISIYPSQNPDSNIIFLFFAVSLGFFLVSMIVIYFFCEICLYYQKEKNTFFLESNYNAIEQQLAQQNQINKKVKEIQHDMKKHIKIANILIRNQDIEFADSLLEDLKNDVENINLGISQTSGNAMIDAVVTNRFSICESKKIKFIYKLEWVGKTHIKPTELLSLVTNLLDNAMEAAEKTNNPVVDLKVFTYKAYLTIIVKNSYLISPNIEDGKLITTKNNKLFHGMGTEIIMEIAKKYNGNYTYTYDKEYFTATVLLLHNLK